MAKIIPFNTKIFGRLTTKENQELNPNLRPLTTLMLKTLRLACEKQNLGHLFGPADIEGSFAALISRGLLKFGNMINNEKCGAGWYVTEEAILLLKVHGLKTK